MYIDAAVLRDVEARYGTPHEIETTLSMAEREFSLCRRAGRNGRAHDVTLLILGPGGGDPSGTMDGPIAVIRKWSYPPDLFRPPSGGVEPGEAFEAGAVREALEETGLVVELERYLVRMRARFEWGGEALDWTTHVVSARWREGEVAPRDTREIAEARWSTLAELDGTLRDRMLATGSAGFRYRVALQDAALARLGVKPWPVETGST